MENYTLAQLATAHAFRDNAPLHVNAELSYGTHRASFDYPSVPTRSSLLSRLRNTGDETSWRTFFETYWRLLYNVARKSGLSDADAQDVVQDTVIAVAKKMPDFRYDPAKGSFKQWLLLITRRRLHDHFRRIYRGRVHGSSDRVESPSSVEAVPSSELPPDRELESAWDYEWKQNLFHAALDRVRDRVNPKHYQVFDYCVLQNLRAPQVARMLGLNSAQVYLAKHRVSIAVKRAAAHLEVEFTRQLPR